MFRMYMLFKKDKAHNRNNLVSPHLYNYKEAKAKAMQLYTPVDIVPMCLEEEAELLFNFTETYEEKGFTRVI